MQAAIYLIGILGLTIPAAYTDWTSKRIPNWLTIPFFVAGLIFQGVFNGGPGLLDAGKAFAIGFGTLYVLWMIGGGGGGDVKLVGALSVWFGTKYTLMLLVVSTGFVLLGTLAVVAASLLKRGLSATKSKYVAESKEKKKKGKGTKRETLAERQKRRIMAYALPIGLAAWILLILDATVFQNGQL